MCSFATTSASISLISRPWGWSLAGLCAGGDVLSWYLILSSLAQWWQGVSKDQARTRVAIHQVYMNYSKIALKTFRCVQLLGAQSMCRLAQAHALITGAS
jgi:hypothetical protein